MGVMVEEQAGSAVPGPRVGTSSVPAWVDRFLASDPGLNRLRLALQAVATIGLAMIVESLFVRATGAMELPAPPGLPAAQAAAIAAQHHAITVIAVMLGAVIGMISSFTGGMFPSIRAQLGGFVLMPVLMVGGLSLGLALAPYRTVSLAILVVILATGAYCRRFGPLGFVGGQMVFMGDFFGFFLNGAVGLKDIGWLAAEIGLAVVVAIVAQFTLFYPGRRRALARMQRSYDARRRDVVDYAVRLLDESAEPARVAAGLQRRLVRLNETALMIDGQLSNPGAIPKGWSAANLHQILFDAELAVSNMARFVAAVAMADLNEGMVPAPVRAAVRETLVAVSRGDYARADRLARDLLDEMKARSCGDEPALDPDLHVVVHRFALSVVGYADAQRRWREADEEARAARRRRLEGSEADGTPDALESPVVLMGGFLPGSTMVSATASEERDPTYDGRGHAWHFWHHVPLTPNVRVAIQMAVAVAATIVLGEVLSGRRFYWAVIAAFVTFMGANNASEQVRKGINRVIGTVVGALVGATLAHLVGTRTHIAIVVILVAIFFGLYLMRVSYAFMVIGITVMVSQLYVQLNEFSNSLLLLRLEETALGAVVAGITVVSVLPLRTGRVARVAAREYLNALGEVVEKAITVLAGSADAEAITSFAPRPVGWTTPTSR